MKSQYRIYGRETAELEKSLTKPEQDKLNKHLTRLAGSCGLTKVNQNKRFILQFRDLIEKPLTEKPTQEDMNGFWALVKISEHEYNTKVMIKKMVKKFVKENYSNGEKLFKGLKVGTFKANRQKINKSVLLKPEDIKKMLHRADTLRDKALLILMYECGGRPQEIKILKWKDIDWNGREVHLDSTKTERDRDIPIEESIIHLKRWRQEWSFGIPNDNDFIFPSRFRDKNMTTEHINNIIKKIANQSGIKKEITSYTLRHSRLTEIYNRGVKGIEHNKFAGHKEGSVMQVVYTHLDNNDMKQDVLKKVYHVEELSETEQTQLKEQIKELQEKIIDMDKRFSKIESNSI